MKNLIFELEAESAYGVFQKHCGQLGIPLVDWDEVQDPIKLIWSDIAIAVIDQVAASQDPE
jgi:hypothetical protein